MVFACSSNFNRIGGRFWFICSFSFTGLCFTSLNVTRKNYFTLLDWETANRIGSSQWNTVGDVMFSNFIVFVFNFLLFRHRKPFNGNLPLLQFICSCGTGGKERYYASGTTPLVLPGDDDSPAVCTVLPNVIKRGEKYVKLKRKRIIRRKLNSGFSAWVTPIRKRTVS